MRRELKAFLCSLCLHLALFIPLTFISLKSMEREPILIDFSLSEPVHTTKEIEKGSSSLQTSKPIHREEKRAEEEEKWKEPIEQKRETFEQKTDLPKKTIVTNTPPITANTILVSEGPTEKKEPTGDTLSENLASGAEKKNLVAFASQALNNPEGSSELGKTSSGKTTDSPEVLKQRYLKEHFSYIRDLIMKNLSYPYIARRQGLSGRVVVSFVIKEDGTVRDLRILESSGFEVLDKNALETIKKVSPFPKPPVSAEIILPILYRLE